MSWTFLLCCLLWQGSLPQETGPYVAVLGIAQDAGFPQAGCAKTCCRAVFAGEVPPRLPVCLALVDSDGRRYMFEATPAFPRQLHALNRLAPARAAAAPDGIFLTHGHIGHYTGLMHLGREVMGAREVPVYAMPRMVAFLGGNGPWDQLLRLGNIRLHGIKADTPEVLSARLRVTPFLVPHRDEYTETVGYLIEGPRRKLAFIPDIDKWSRLARPIEELIARVDVAYLDATFYADGELPGRNAAEVPHPFVTESLARFAALPESERAKVRFIHFNHTNPLLQPESKAAAAVKAAGMHVAREGEIEQL